MSKGVGGQTAQSTWERGTPWWQRHIAVADLGLGAFVVFCIWSRSSNFRGRLNEVGRKQQPLCAKGREIDRWIKGCPELSICGQGRYRLGSCAASVNVKVLIPFQQLPMLSVPTPALSSY